MARDPNALKYPESWVDIPDDLKKLPPPPGVGKSEWDAKVATGQYYANVKVYQDGRRVVEWYQRNVGGGPGQPDPVQATTQDTLPNVKEEWDKGEEKASELPAPRNINGVLHEPIRGSDGQIIWTPVQTANGPASAAAAPRGGVPADATPRIEGTPRGDGTFDNNAPIMVWRRPDGTQVDARPLQQHEREQWERERAGLPPDVGARSSAQQQPQTISAPPTQPFIVREMPDGTIRTEKNPNYTGDKPEAGKAIQVKGGDGKTYLVPINPDGTPGTPRDLGVPADPGQQQSPYTSVQQDKETGRWYGLTRDGQWREIPGGPGATPATNTTRAPSLPQIVVGSSQDALRRAYDEIQAEVDSGRRTAAWGENRRKEVYEAARLTVSEAQLHEQSRQFNQSQAESLATTKLNYGQNALDSALRFALQINGKIAKGSSAGANLFRNVFLMQMQMARDSGIYDVTPGGGRSSVGVGMGAAGQQPTATRAGDPATRPPLPVGDTDALAAGADAAAANIAAGLEANGQPREYTPATATTGGGSPLPMPATAEGPGRVVNPPLPASTTAPLAPSAPAPAGSAPVPAPTPAGPPPADGAPQAMTRPVLDPAMYGHTPENPLAPRTDPSQRFAALEEFRSRMPTAPATPPPVLDPAMYGHTPENPLVVPPNPHDPAMGLPPAIRAARIRATPPWRLPPEALPSLIDEFGPDVVYGVPGMAREGVA